MFKYFIVPTSPTPVAFSKTPRGKLTHAADCMTSCRFPSCTPTSWNYHGERSDLLCFSVDKNITLHGLRLFGSENNSYTVTLKVTDTGSRTTVVSKSGTYYPKLLHSKRFSYHGFEVMFDSAAVLKNNTSYLIEALISGPWSGKGDNGLGTVKASSVTFFHFLPYTGKTATIQTLMVVNFQKFFFSIRQTIRYRFKQHIPKLQGHPTRL